VLESPSFNELNKCRAIIFTALKLEYCAVRKHLQNLEKVSKNNKNYEIGTFNTDDKEWEVLICKTDVGNSEAAHITTSAIEAFYPDIAIFSGIGGSLKDAKIKDVVIATQVFNYESAKVTESESLARPKGIQISPDIGQIVEDIELFFPSDDFSIFRGPIVSGEKVLAAKNIEEVNFIRTHYNNALALDMEGYGFAHSAFSLSKPFALIRSISDELKNKNEKRDKKNQPIAAANAAIIAFELLSKFNPIQKANANKPIIPEVKNSTKVDDSRYIMGSSQTASPLNLGILKEEIPVALEYHRELDTIKELLRKNQPSAALDQLNALYNRINGVNLNAVKYRIFSYKGVGFLQLKKFNDAARAFIEAYGYNRSDEKAQINAAYGYFLLKEYEPGNSLILNVIKQNPVNATANSVLVYIRSINENLDKIIAAIPHHISATPEVALVIGSIYYSKCEFNKSNEWLKLAYDKSDGKDPNISSIFASSIVNSVKSDKTTLQGRQLKEEHYQKLRQAERLLTEVLDLVKSDTELQNKYIFCLTERGSIRQYLGEREKGFDDIITAYNKNPNDPMTIIHRALIDIDQGKNLQVETSLKGILFNEEVSDAKFVYLEALKRQGKYSEAISCIGNMLDSKIISSPQKKALQIIKIDLYINQGKDFFENAETDARILFQENTKDVESRLTYGRTLRRIRKLELAKEVLSEIGRQDIETANPVLALKIADEYFELGNFKEAADIYEKFIDPTILSPYTVRYIESLYKFEKLRKVLDICRSLHANGHISQPTAIRELLICEEIGDLNAARAVCKQYLESFPDDLLMQYNLALTNFKLQNMEKVDQFLEQNFSAKKCGWAVGVGISRMLVDRNQLEKALEFAYDLRREFYNLPEAHENYILICLNREKSLPELGDIEKVQTESAVYLKNNSNGDEFVCVIESRKDLSLLLKEKSVEDPFIKKIIGKAKGELIPTGGAISESEKIEITDICHKYVYAFRESFKEYNKIFPDSSGVKKISEDPIKKLFKLVKQNHDFKLNIINLYLEKEIPISAIATKIKINSYELFSQFSSSTDLGIFSSSGKDIDIIVSSNQLFTGKKIILDISSLYTINSLKLEDLILNTFGKPVVTHSLLNELNSLLISIQQPLNKSEHESPVQKDGKIVLETVSLEQIDAEKQNLIRILEWVKLNCDIVPCYPLLDLSHSKIEKAQFIGKTSLDNIYLSSDDNYILFTDDKILSTIAKNECGSNSVSIQDILCYLHWIGKINEEEHVSLLIQLFEMNYYYIQFSLLFDPRFCPFHPPSPL